MNPAAGSLPIEHGGWGATFLARRPVRDDVSPWRGVDRFERTSFVVGAHPIVEAIDAKQGDELGGAKLRDKLIDVLDDANAQWTSLGVFRLGYPFENPSDIPVTLVITLMPDSMEVDLAVEIVRRLCVVLEE